MLKISFSDVQAEDSGPENQKSVSQIQNSSQEYNGNRQHWINPAKIQHKNDSLLHKDS